MGTYYFLVVTQSFYQLSGESKKTSVYCSRSQSSEVPAVLTYYPSQSNKFKSLLQDKPGDKQKSHISWNPNLSQTNHNFWNPNLSQSSNFTPSTLSYRFNEKDTKISKVRITSLEQIAISLFRSM